MKLKALEIINSTQRNSSIDVFRGCAVLSVLLFHFNILPFGSLGVDLFFVISGFLVGGLLLKDYTNDKPINFFRFVLQRGFKIWPSYYTFILLGNLLVYLLCSSYAADEVIQLNDYKRYLFFYQNYTGNPQSNVFFGVWSLCVEEHFYILLPLMMITLYKFRANKNVLFTCVSLIIVAGILFKFLALYYTNSKDTFAATHNRIDALAWGVLLNLIVTYYPNLLKNFTKKYLLIITGFIVFGATVGVGYLTTSVIYHNVLIHSLVPFSFFLMIAGAFHYEVSGLKAIRFVAYYSYNLYLWHPVVLLITGHYLGHSIIGFIAFVSVSLSVAIIATTLIEEPFLNRRKRVVDFLFPARAKEVHTPVQNLVIPEPATVTIVQENIQVKN